MSIDAGQQVPPEEQKQENPTPAVPVPVPERHPTAEEWDDLLQILSAQYRLTSVQTDLLKQAAARLSGEEQERLEILASGMTAIRQLLEQAAQTRERRSLPKLRPPKLPRPSPGWLIPPAVLFGLVVVLHSGAVLWRELAALLP